jgi:hypothetical protein
MLGGIACRRQRPPTGGWNGCANGAQRPAIANYFTLLRVVIIHTARAGKMLV